MPWEESTVLDRRREFVILAQEGVQSLTALCRRYGISRTTGYKWLGRYLETGSLTDLEDQSRRPLRSPGRTDPSDEQRAVDLRQELGWGARKLRILLQREGIQLSEATLNRIIKRNGLLKQADRQGHATQRFERRYPNELWQMDFKGHLALADKGRRCYPLSILDDHSRFLIGLFALPSVQVGPTRDALRRAFTRYGLPEQILTDHGTPFWSTTNSHGLTQVNVEIMNQDIQLLHGAIRHPQTQGKVERLHRTLQEEMNHRGHAQTLAECQTFFDAFRDRYNQERPHEALGMDVPAARYTTSPRTYTPMPRPWEYDPTMAVHQLNTQGSLNHQGQRLFVCEALAEQWVGTLVFEGKLVVQFRDLLIREIDLETRRGIAFTS